MVTKFAPAMQHSADTFTTRDGLADAEAATGCRKLLRNVRGNMRGAARINLGETVIGAFVGAFVGIAIGEVAGDIIGGVTGGFPGIAHALAAIVPLTTLAGIIGGAAAGMKGVLLPT